MAGKRPLPKVQTPLPARGEDLSVVLSTALRPLVERLTSIEAKLDSMQKEISDSKQSVEKLQKKQDQCQKTVDGHDSRLEIQSNLLLKIQMDKANYSLRFQNVPEIKGENLKDLLSDALAPLTGLEAEKLKNDMDIAYRAYPEFLKKKNLPGEIMLRFSKRSTRDLVLKSTNRAVLKIQGTDIRVLKDIPFEIRRRRKAYRNLIQWLQTENIVYRWLIPEGVQFLHKDKKVIIESTEKARLFLEKHQKKKAETTQEVDRARKGKTQGQTSSESEEEEEEEEEETDSEKGAAAAKQTDEGRRTRRTRKK